MSTPAFDPKAVPPERWGGALAVALLAYLNAEGLTELVRGGKKKFVKEGLKTDAFGLKAEHYEQCYSKLARRAKDLGLDV
jgi:hypothetical protein